MIAAGAQNSMNRHERLCFMLVTKHFGLQLSAMQTRRRWTPYFRHLQRSWQPDRLSRSFWIVERTRNVQMQFGDDGGRKPSDLLQKLFCYFVISCLSNPLAPVNTHKDSKIMSTCRWFGSGRKHLLCPCPAVWEPGERLTWHLWSSAQGRCFIRSHRQEWRLCRWPKHVTAEAWGLASRGMAKSRGLFW